MKNTLTLISTVLIAALLIQKWNGSYKGLGVILPIAILVGLLYFALLIYGIIKRKVILALAFPLFLVSFYFFFQLINWQLKSNYNKATRLIEALERYKSNTGRFPQSLAKLSSKYILEVPLESYGIASNTFSYHTYENDIRFRLEVKRSKTPYKIYESSMHTWQFLD